MSERSSGLLLKQILFLHSGFFCSTSVRSNDAMLLFTQLSPRRDACLSALVEWLGEKARVLEVFGSNPAGSIFFYHRMLDGLSEITL